MVQSCLFILKHCGLCVGLTLLHMIGIARCAKLCPNYTVELPCIFLACYTHLVIERYAPVVVFSGFG